MESVIPPNSEFAHQLTSLHKVKAPIQTITGDATNPLLGGRPAIIAHSCNSAGHWGAGFVLSLNSRWKEPMEEYMKLTFPAEKGLVQFVEVSPSIMVANIIGKGDPSETIPVDYSALRKGFATVRQKAIETGAGVHMPKVGSGLGRGDFEKVKQIVEEELSEHGIDVTIYERVPGYVKIQGSIYKRGN